MPRKTKYTSLVGVKWTQESLEKCLLGMYTRYYKKVHNSKLLTEEEKVKKICLMSVRFRSIYNPIRDYGVTVKKA